MLIELRLRLSESSIDWFGRNSLSGMSSVVTAGTASVGSAVASANAANGLGAPIDDAVGVTSFGVPFIPVAAVCM